MDKISNWSELRPSEADPEVLEVQSVDCGYQETGEDWILSALKLDIDWERRVKQTRESPIVIAAIKVL